MRRIWVFVPSAFYQLFITPSFSRGYPLCQLQHNLTRNRPPPWYHVVTHFLEAGQEVLHRIRNRDIYMPQSLIVAKEAFMEQLESRHTLPRTPGVPLFDPTESPLFFLWILECVHIWM